jgi:hypothetical protein
MFVELNQGQSDTVLGWNACLLFMMFVLVGCGKNWMVSVSIEHSFQTRFWEEMAQKGRLFTLLYVSPAKDPPSQ